MRTKEAILAKYGKERLGQVSEDDLAEVLEEYKDDEALCEKIHANWKRATTKPKVRFAPEPPVSEPVIQVHDLGLHSQESSEKTSEEPAPEEVPESSVVQEGMEEEPLSDVMGSCRDTLLALFLQQRQHFEYLQAELMSLRFSLSIMVGMLAATFFMANWGDTLAHWFM